jgi:hypothetical protein
VLFGNIANKYKEVKPSTPNKTMLQRLLNNEIHRKKNFDIVREVFFYFVHYRLHLLQGMQCTDPNSIVTANPNIGSIAKKAIFSIMVGK